MGVRNPESSLMIVQAETLGPRGKEACCCRFLFGCGLTLPPRVYRWNRLNEEMCLSGCTAADGEDYGHRGREPKGLEVLKMEFLGSGVKGTPLF